MKKLFSLAIISATIVFSSCYKDKVSEVYPGAGLFTPCDTTSHPSYSKHIVPIIQNYCIGCHSTSNPRGTADLSTYAGVYPWTTTFSPPIIVGNVWHLNGYYPMPPSFQLDSCQMKQIKNWCADGAPNN